MRNGEHRFPISHSLVGAELGFRLESLAPQFLADAFVLKISALVAGGTLLIHLRRFPMQDQQPARSQPSLCRFMTIFDDEVMIRFQQRHAIGSNSLAGVNAVVYLEPPQARNRLKAAPDVLRNRQRSRCVNDKMNIRSRGQLQKGAPTYPVRARRMRSISQL